MTPYVPIITRRLEHWPLYLVNFVESRRNVPFAWAANDCCSFAADAVQEMTGIDVLAKHRNSYSNAFEAQTIVDSYGGVAALWEALLQDSPMGNVSMMQRGDVGLVVIEGRETVAVNIGSHVVGPGEAGLVALPTREVVQAWIIGER